MKKSILQFAAPLLLTLPVLAQSSLSGTWVGSATVHEQQVPVRLEIKADGAVANGAFLSGPERWAANSGTVDGNHVVLKFDYFLRTFDGTVQDGVLTGIYGNKKVKYPITLKRGAETTSASVVGAPDISGRWEIALDKPSSKGESAWNLEIDQKPSLVKAAVLRIDGDTGGLYGNYDPAAKEFRLSHFTAANPALWVIKPQEDGTLIVSNPVAPNQVWTARRPTEARKENLAPPTELTAQTKWKDPNQPLAFTATDLNGKTVSSTDPRFEGKVVIVAIGGSWCPNCHDEAPLLESLYKKYHARGLEIVNLSFEQEEDELKNPTRVKAFVKRYNITYPVLLAGTTDQLNEKITGADNLNCWPTSFFVGRDGKVEEIHAGFSGPATGKAHEELVQETTTLVEKLLKEKTTVASR